MILIAATTGGAGNSSQLRPAAPGKSAPARGLSGGLLGPLLSGWMTGKARKRPDARPSFRREEWFQGRRCQADGQPRPFGDRGCEG